MAQSTGKALSAAIRKEDVKELGASIEYSLLTAIKNDDIKAFEALIEGNRGGTTYRLGRFPLLSLMYLYKSRKLIAAYETRFISITNYEELGEPLEISTKFAAKAGKCLRRYLNEIVSPLEMLLILDKTRRLKRVYPLAKNVSSAIKWRLNSIYYIKYSLSVKFEGNDIIIEKRPLNYSEKKRIATICISVVLAIIIVIGLPVTTYSLIPKPVEGEVTKLKQIDFASDKAYTLKKDITLPENYIVEEVNCEILGNGHKLVFGSGAQFVNFNGKLSNVTIESTGEPIINTAMQNALIEDVTVNINVDMTVEESTSLFALSNYGVIRDVTFNVSGKFKAVAGESESSLTFGGIVWENNYNYQYDSSTDTFFGGLIEKCTVNFSQFVLEGEASADASFGGISAVNNGCIEECVVTGDITANTFDVAGFSYLNYILIRDSVNQANISQTSSNDGWSPVVSGIVTNNGSTVERCLNAGNLSATSTAVAKEGEEPAVSVSGIAYINSGFISQSINRGALNATGKGDAYAGGIAGRSVSQISECISSGDIVATAKTVYAGGVLATSEVTSQWGFDGLKIYFGTVDYCISECKISATGSATSYVGGIVGYVYEQGFGVTYFGGCVRNSFFVGEVVSSVEYVGAIVGACGANIYENNSYSNGAQYYNFADNYFLNSYDKAFGAVVSGEDEYVSAEDKGATAATIEEIKALETYKNILKLFS